MSWWWEIFGIKMKCKATTLEKNSWSSFKKNRHEAWIFHYLWKLQYRFVANEAYCDNFSIFQIPKYWKVSFIFVGKMMNLQKTVLWTIKFQTCLKHSTCITSGVGAIIRPHESSDALSIEGCFLSRLLQASLGSCFRMSHFGSSEFSLLGIQVHFDREGTRNNAY